MRIRRVILSGTLVLLPVVPAWAAPIDIHVLSAQYSTSLWAQYYDAEGNPAPILTETTESPFVLDEAIDISSVFYARASSDVFGVAASTSAYPDRTTWLNGFGQSRATADTAITFAPLQDGVASIELAFLTGNFESFFTEARVGLFDVTANQQLWSYESIRAFGNVPWPEFGCCTATVGLTQALLASHVYALTIHADSQASSDSMQMAVKVSGFHNVPEPSTQLQVPEPSTLLLVGMGVAGLMRRRCS